MLAGIAGLRLTGGPVVKLPCRPLLSVITPSYEMARFLPDALDSVAALRTHHEHVVIDGASGDGTVELLQQRRDPSLVWASEPDGGQTEAVNKGLASARGELLAWLNADDVYLSEAVDRAVEHLAANPATKAVYGAINYMDADGTVFRTLTPPRFSWRRYLYLGTFLPTPTIIFRRELLDQAPTLDERYADAADYDFYLRLLRGVRVDRIDEPLVKFRYHPASKSSSDVWTQLDEAQRVRLGWATNPLQRGVMRGWEGAKRAILPRISSWPNPEPAGAVKALRRLRMRA
jgi:glycosyltransferase involved in cell wall biosynthesis